MWTPKIGYGDVCDVTGYELDVPWKLSELFFLEIPWYMYSLVKTVICSKDNCPSYRAVRFKEISL